MSPNPELSPAPRWISTTLRLAAGYNLIWGIWIILAPQQSLDVCGYPGPVTYPEFWQCIGMMVGVFGIGYGIAALDPYRHWPMVLVGLLGKVFGPIGFVWSWGQGTLPLSAGKTIIFNDLIWWIPFAMILWQAFRYEQNRSTGLSTPLSLDAALHQVRDNLGQNLAELSVTQPRLVVFLRHAGCTFCREALSDLSRQRAAIEAKGTKLALVHMSSNEDAERLFQQYALADVPRFSDPEQILYRAFELGLGRFPQLFGWEVFRRGFSAAILERHGFGPLQGNGFRMPGVFLLDQGRIIAAMRHQTAADRPDYVALSCPVETERTATPNTHLV